MAERLEPLLVRREAYYPKSEGEAAGTTVAAAAQRFAEVAREPAGR
jgi:hypothetical protein